MRQINSRGHFKAAHNHAVVYEHGLHVRLLLTAGHASDNATTPALVEGLPTSQAVIAYRFYDCQYLARPIHTDAGLSPMLAG